MTLPATTCPRRMQFLGRPIRHGGLCPTRHMRLFRSGMGRCEMRKYDQHFYVLSGKARQLKRVQMRRSEDASDGVDCSPHRWAEAEVEELTSRRSPKTSAAKSPGAPLKESAFCGASTTAFLYS